MILDLEQENEILVYIDENYSEAKAKSVGSQINLISNVHEAKFVSRQQALDEFVATQNDAELFAGIEADTLRDRFVVTLEDNSLITQTKQMLEQIDGVSEVVAHDEIANGFQTVQKVLNIAAMVIIVVLFVVSMFIISNTIKLAMYSRSQEIAIMKMVGATNSFIRLPFVVEGLILGFISSLVAFFLEWGLYDFLASKIAQIDTLQLDLQRRQLEAQQAALLASRPDIRAQAAALREQIAKQERELAGTEPAAGRGRHHQTARRYRGADPDSAKPAVGSPLVARQEHRHDRRQRRSRRVADRRAG